MALGIRCHQVHKTYGTGAGRFEAVRAVDFTVETGEFVSLLGPSGCGKSTLLMMVGGLEAITSGSIELRGERVEGPSKNTGIVFQDATLLPWKSALDNILFPVDLQRRPRAAYQERAQALLQAMGLAGAAGRKPGQLSGGMRQRVSICRALIDDPEVLLMDEPFSALDAMTRDDMNMLLLDLWQRYRKTALFVTHSIREAVLLSDRVLVMGGSPSTVVEDVRVPFPRPRDFSLTELPEFNALCARLRARIAHASTARSLH